MKYFLTKLMFKMPDWMLLRLSGSPQKTAAGDRKLHPGSQFLLANSEKEQMMALDESKTIDELRAWWVSQLEMIKKPALKGVSFNDRQIDVDKGSIRIREYIPDDVEQNSPALVYVHGGGWTWMSIDTNHAFSEFLCKELHVKVYAMDYRQAPEHPFPIPLNDVNAAYQWVVDNAVGLGVDASRISIAGDSAGGNLAAAICAKRQLDGTTLPKAQLLICPHVDLTTSCPSNDEFATGYFLTKAHVEWFASNYGPDVETRNNPLASPFLAESLSGHPSAVVVTAGFDVLRDEGNIYAQKLTDSGVDTQIFEYPSFLHGFYLVDLMSAVSEANTEYCTAFKRLL